MWGNVGQRTGASLCEVPLLESFSRGSLIGPSAGIQRTEWPSPKGTLQVGLLAGVTAAFSVAILNLGLLEFTYPLNGEYQ
jgi:hypothetical protein